MEKETNNVGENMTPNMNGSQEGSVGPIIGTIIILAVIVLGGFYFWGQRANNQVMDEAQVNQMVEDITTQSQSDATADIEADLDSTEIDDLDKELNAL